jgi:hypothetical protein
VKAAEAAAEAAKHHGRVKIVTAESELEAADKMARAKARIAEGVQAEAAAEGLAKVRVREADAQAIEKVGMAEARIALEKMQSVALGEEKQGLAKVKVAEAEAVAIEKKGLAEALVIKERLSAEASGEEQKGLAKVKVLDAEADIILKRGSAEADAARQKALAEAAGITEKATAMKHLDVESRQHEEFRIRLQAQKEIAIQSLDARTKIATEQAKILAEAFDDAKIQIVGGDGAFFDRFVKAMSLGQAFDVALDQSETLRGALGDYLKPSSANGGSDNVTLSTLLGRLMAGAEGDAKDKIAKLALRAKEMGIDAIDAAPRAPTESP